MGPGLRREGLQQIFDDDNDNDGDTSALLTYVGKEIK